MKFQKTIAWASCSIIIALIFCYGKKLPKPAIAINPGFAVVELFTSEGCSSCPAAEAVLARLHSEYTQHVYVMEFHVDYWNYIGWKDVFSSSAYTQRQQQYARVFRLGSTYTPQAIVNGKKELVGSDRAKLNDLINIGLKQAPQATIQLSASSSKNRITVSYITANANSQNLNIALVQKKAETNVKQGENSGRKLQHINIVRAIKTIELADEKGNATIDLPDGLSPADCTIIAYTQQKSNWEVTGAADCSIGN